MIVYHVLLGGARDGVMVQQQAYLFLQCIRCFRVKGYFGASGGVLRQAVLGQEPEGGVGHGGEFPDEQLEGGPGGKVAYPVVAEVLLVQRHEVPIHLCQLNLLLRLFEAHGIIVIPDSAELELEVVSDFREKALQGLTVLESLLCQLVGEVISHCKCHVVKLIGVDVVDKAIQDVLRVILYGLQVGCYVARDVLGVPIVSRWEATWR